MNGVLLSTGYLIGNVQILVSMVIVLQYQLVRLEK